ncbi:hypothetical protein ACE6H2_001745 [Prunus campanulata]
MATYKCIQFKNPKFPHTTLTPKQSRPTLRSAQVNPRKSNLAPTPALSTSSFLANFDLGILGASSIHSSAIGTNQVRVSLYCFEKKLVPAAAAVSITLESHEKERLKGRHRRCPP